MRWLRRFDAQEKNKELHAQLDAMFTNNSALFENKNFVQGTYSAESSKHIEYKDEKALAMELATALEEAGVRDALKEHCGYEHVTDAAELARLDEQLENAMEIAAMTALALADDVNYHKAYCNAKLPSEANVKNIGAVMNGQAMAESYQYSTEGYDNFEFGNFRGTAIMTNALNSMTNSYEDVFFKPVMISPAEHGADVSIRIPYVFNTKYRETNGAEYNVDQKLVIDAYRDRSILANTGNAVYVNVANTGVDSLVAPLGNGIVNIPKDINGTVVNTRPILFNKTVGLTGASAHAGLNGADKQSQEDTLSPTMMLGDLYVRIDDGTTSAVVVIDTSALGGALFVPSQTGNTEQLQLFVNTVAQFTHDNKTADGTALSTIAKLANGVGNAAPTDAFSVTLGIKLSGEAWPRRGNMEVNHSGDTPVQITSARNSAGDKVDDTVLATLRSDLTVSLVGYVPKVTRTNSNLRDKGQMVDLGNTIKYRLAVPILSPITASEPLNMEGGAPGQDGLQMINRARKTGIATQTMFDYRDVIKACNGVKTEHAGIGAELITPTYVPAKVTLRDRTVILRSAGAREDVREAIGAAVDQVFSTLLEQSGYLATHAALYGNETGFEAIIATSPRIHSLLMTSGDARLLGANRKYTIVSSYDVDFEDKIFISVRRIGTTGVDPMTFAHHVTMPPLVYKAPVHVDNGSHSRITQLLPRDLYVGTCPLLGEIDILGLDSLFTDI